MTSARPLIAVSDKQLERQIRAAIFPPVEHRDRFSSSAPSAPPDGPVRRPFIMGARQLSRLKGMKPARLRAIKKRARIIVVLEDPDPGRILEAIELADGIVFQSINLDRISMITNLVQWNYTAVPALLISMILHRGLRRELVHSLSSLERDVLRLIRVGLTNRAIGETLDLDEGRTKYLIRVVLKKLHLQNRTQAAVFAARDVFLAPAAASGWPVARAAQFATIVPHGRTLH